MRTAKQVRKSNKTVSNKLNGVNVGLLPDKIHRVCHPRFQGLLGTSKVVGSGKRQSNSAKFCGIRIAHVQDTIISSIEIVTIVPDFKN